MKETITVFTPTYNRAHCLHLCYQSLKRQTLKDFKWLIIDDGSEDGTKEVISKWQGEEKDFKIEYIYKENGGLHTGYNVAIENITTELCICIDSDDYMPDDAIEKILKLWESKGGKQYAGIIGLDFYTNNTLIGLPLPDTESVDINELFVKGKLVGDKKLVIRTELYKKVAPMKGFVNEKNFNPNYMNILIGEEKEFLIINENLCYVEYQKNGMTNNIFNQYMNSPRSFCELRKLYMSLKKANFKFKLRHAIHYDSSCILAKRYKDIVVEAPNPLLTTLVFPIGLILSFYIRYKVK